MAGSSVEKEYNPDIFGADFASRRKHVIGYIGSFAPEHTNFQLLFLFLMGAKPGSICV